MLWLVPDAGEEEVLWEAIAGVDPTAEQMAAERLPTETLRYAGG